MRRIGVVTVGRSDYNIYRPLLRKMAAHPGIESLVLAGGMHLSKAFGYTVRMIEEDGFTVASRVAAEVHGDDPASISKAMGHGLIGFADVYHTVQPDLLVVLGDRYEMIAAALAAVPFNIPVAHIHGGELTEGAMDDAFRHALTKLSHLHFVSLEKYGRRVIQMGEEPWRVTVSGAPALDALNEEPRFSRAELEKTFGLSLTEPPLLVTFHPVTREYEQTEYHITQLLEALLETGRPVVFTLPNADTENRVVQSRIRDYVNRHARAWLVENFGEAYFSMMAHSAAMIGNSSSGIIEAASFKLPVVNIGSRQKGRVHGSNVVDVGYGHDEIKQGIRRVLDPAFGDELANVTNPYGDGQAAERIMERLTETAIDDRLLRKSFHDMR